VSVFSEVTARVFRSVNLNQLGRSF